LIDILKKELNKNEINISLNSIEELNIFANKLMWWNNTHNITGAKTKDDIIKNIIDSIYPIKFIDKPKKLLDVGTGAGFPGLVLAIVLKDTKSTLAEPINKRASFLRYMVTQLSLKNTTIFKDRVERLKDDKFDLITSRAVTNTKLLLELTKELSNSDTKYLFFKGERVFSEVKDLDNKYIYDIVTKGRRNYLYIKGLK